MPTNLQSGPFRPFSYFGDGREPPHVHVEHDDCEAKFWLDPLRLERSRGFSLNEILKNQRLIEDNRQHLLNRWHEFFNA